MPRSIAEIITEDVAETLNSIKLVGGYHFDFVVERADKVHVPKDGLCILDMDPPERDLQGCLLHDTWFLNYTITVYVTTSDAWDQTVAERMALAYSDVYTALMADPHRAEMALNSEMGAATYNNEAGEIPSIDVGYKVHMRTLQGQPNQL